MLSKQSVTRAIFKPFIGMKLIHNLSGDEMRKECIKLGLCGRLTMKEALVEVATALVRVGKDPRVHQFFPSLPSLGTIRTKL